MRERARATTITADDLLRLPNDGWRYELVRGELVRMSPTSSRSSLVSSNIHNLVASFVKRKRLGLCGDSDWGFVLATNPDIVRAPDVGVVLAARIPAEGIPPGYWPGAPDFAVEVISPSDRFADVLEKVEEYLAHGTRLVWVIDPEARKAIVFRPGQPPETVGAKGTLSGEDVLPGFTLRLAAIWV